MADGVHTFVDDLSADKILGRSSMSATDKRGAILLEAVSDGIVDLCSEALTVSP